MDFMSNAGLYIAVIGASLAVALACAGSGKGVGIVGEAAAGVISEDPGKFSSCLILQILPGTQGLYGLVVWFYALFTLGVIGGTPADSDRRSGYRLLRGLPAHGHRRLCHRHRSGPLRRCRCQPGRQAPRGDVQGYHHGHHGRVLRHPVPAGFLPDAAVHQVSTASIFRKDGANL